MTSGRVRYSDFDRAASCSEPSMRIGPEAEDDDGSSMPAVCDDNGLLSVFIERGKAECWFWPLRAAAAAEVEVEGVAGGIGLEENQIRVRSYEQIGWRI